MGLRKTGRGETVTVPQMALAALTYWYVLEQPTNLSWKLATWPEKKPEHLGKQDKDPYLMKVTAWLGLWDRNQTNNQAKSLSMVGHTSQPRVWKVEAG